MAVIAKAWNYDLCGRRRRRESGDISVFNPGRAGEPSRSVSFDGLYDDLGNYVSHYKLPINDQDDYVKGGFENFVTFLVDSDTDLTKLAPGFTVFDGTKLYAEWKYKPLR